MRNGEQTCRQRVFAKQYPIAVNMFGVGQKLIAQLVDRFLHRIERIALAGQNAELDQLVKLFR